MTRVSYCAVTQPCRIFKMPVVKGSTSGSQSPAEPLCLGPLHPVSQTPSKCRGHFVDVHSLPLHSFQDCREAGAKSQQLTSEGGVAPQTVGGINVVIVYDDKLKSLRLVCYSI